MRGNEEHSPGLGFRTSRLQLADLPHVKSESYGGKSLARFAATWGGPNFPLTIPLTAPPRGGPDLPRAGEGGALPGCPGSHASRSFGCRGRWRHWRADCCRSVEIGRASCRERVEVW